MANLFEVHFSPKMRSQVGLVAELRRNNAWLGLPVISMGIIIGVLIGVVGIASHSPAAVAGGLLMVGLAGLAFWLQLRRTRASVEPIPDVAFSLDDHAIHFPAFPLSRRPAQHWALGDTSLAVRPGARGVLTFSNGAMRRRFATSGLDVDLNQLVNEFDTRKAVLTGSAQPPRERLDAPASAPAATVRYFETPALAVVLPVISVAGVLGGVACAWALTKTRSHEGPDFRWQLWAMALILISIAAEMQRRHFAATGFRWRNDMATLTYWALMAIAVVMAIVGPLLLTLAH